MASGVPLKKKRTLRPSGKKPTYAGISMDFPGLITKG